MLELDDVDEVVSIDEEESVRSALRLSLRDGLVPLICDRESNVRGVLLGVAIEDSALPLGVARLDMELKALALEGGLERFLVVGHLGGLCGLLWMVVGGVVAVAG